MATDGLEKFSNAVPCVMVKYMVKPNMHGGKKMGQVATITSKSMVTIPSKIRKKYSLRQGSKVEFVEVEEGLLLVPLKSLRELRGTAKEKSDLLISAVRELEREHREEATT